VSDDLAVLLRLDRELDDLAGATAARHGHPPSGGGWPAGAGDDFGDPELAGELAGELAATAVRLRDSVPDAAPGTAARGREAFLEAADALARSERRRGRRRLLIQAGVLAAALLLIAVQGALARQALPGSPLYPVREAAQGARLALASSPVDKARQLLDQASGMRAAAVAYRSGRDDCISTGTAKVQDALRRLRGVPGDAAAVQRSRADDLLDDFRDLAEGRAPDGHGGRSPGDNRGGRGSDDRGGPGSGRGPGSEGSMPGGSGRDSGSGSGSVASADGSGSGKSGGGRTSVGGG
jgi:hypothetical protein